MTSVFHREYLAPALAGCPSIVFVPKRVELTTVSHASHENSSDASESDATSGYARLQARPYKMHIESRMAGIGRRVRSPQSDDSYLKDLKPGKNLMNPAFGPSIAIVTAPEPMYHGSLASAAALPLSKFIHIWRIWSVERTWWIPLLVPPLLSSRHPNPCITGLSLLPLRYLGANL